MKIYSSIYGAGSDERVSHANISKNDMSVAPAIVIMFLRISLFLRICLRAPCQLFMTLPHAMGPMRSWMRSVANDLKFLATKSASFADYGSSTLPEWVATVRQNPRAFKKHLKAATSEPAVNDISARATTKKLREVDSAFTCALCQFSCGSRQQLALHCSPCNARIC